MFRNSVWELIGHSLALSVFLDNKPPRARWDDSEPQRPERRRELPARTTSERR